MEATIYLGNHDIGTTSSGISDQLRDMYSLLDSCFNISDFDGAASRDAQVTLCTQHYRYKPSKFSMDKDLNLRRLNPFKTDINIVRHNFKNQSQQTDLRKHFPGETYPTTSNTMNQSLRENNT